MAEGARASDLGWTIISGLVRWWVAVEEEGKERRTKRKGKKGKGRTGRKEDEVGK